MNEEVVFYLKCLKGKQPKPNPFAQIVVTLDGQCLGVASTTAAYGMQALFIKHSERIFA